MRQGARAGNTAGGAQAPLSSGTLFATYWRHTEAPKRRAQRRKGARAPEIRHAHDILEGFATLADFESPAFRDMTSIAVDVGRVESAQRADDAPGDDFKPLDAEQAQRWRAENPPQSPWTVVWVQAAVGVLAVALAAAIGSRFVIQSVAYGALAAWLPAALFVRVLARRLRPGASAKNAGGAGAALAALMVWEGIKVALTVALLVLAPRILVEVHWLALVAGFVVTIKAAWIALWWFSARQRRSGGGQALLE